VRTRDLVSGDSIPVVGERYAVVLEPQPIIVDGEVVEGACENDKDRVRLSEEFVTVRQAATALNHESLEALKGTLELDWLTHDRIYLLSSFMGGVAVEAFGLEAVAADRAAKWGTGR
jgi:hypothetical protein